MTDEKKQEGTEDINTIAEGEKLEADYAKESGEPVKGN